MMNAILVLNIGSSTIKFALYDESAQDELLRGGIDHIGSSPAFHVSSSQNKSMTLPTNATTEVLVAALLDWIEALDYRLAAVGHRVVHGGRRFSAPTVIDDNVMAYLRSLCSLAPLHQPHNLAGIDAITARRPALPQVACFDTAFHRTQPPVAELFALPRAMADDGIIRYGFHGLSYDYISRKLPDHMGAHGDGRIIVAHLGAGSSMCAMKARKSVATTMGFTALDGLPMATRSGSIDPGVLLYLVQEKGLNGADLETLLYRQSGLLGLSGISGDMRDLMASNEAAAQQAVEVYCYQISRSIGSLAAALGGLDGLVFTAGIGERAAPVRAAVCDAARWLGVDIDLALNAKNALSIGTAKSAVSVLIIPTNEEAVIAEAVAKKSCV